MNPRQKAGKKKTHPTSVRCVSWVQRHAGADRTKMNPYPKAKVKIPGFMQGLRFCLIGQPSLNKNETALFDVIFIT